MVPILFTSATVAHYHIPYKENLRLTIDLHMLCLLCISTLAVSNENLSCARGVLAVRLACITVRLRGSPSD